jgi:transposase
MLKRFAKLSVGRRLRFVPAKDAKQQSVLMLHRARSLLVRQRTMLVNALRAHMAEFGIIAPQGLRIGTRSANSIRASGQMHRTEGPDI